ncbi:MAG: DUF485 domain-containing protein [Gammaproteobacteria bacterium]|nr:DUF485 domain-containing protein [Gammaproteobacteria bacterium]
MMDEFYEKIFEDAEFQALQRRRSRFSWTLAAIMFTAYFAFIGVIAFAPRVFAIPLGPDTVITWGIPAGVSIIVLGFILTAIYVFRANGEFDRDNEAIIKRLERSC